MAQAQSLGKLDYMKSILYRLMYRLLKQRSMAWRELLARRRVDLLRREGMMLTATDSTVATLRLYGLLPSPLVALDAYGKFGLRKTLDYAELCESLDFYEFDPEIARLASRFLPKLAKVHCADTVAVVREGRLPRRDYSFIMIDNYFGVYGAGYCDHFDLFPKLFDYLAPLAVIVANVLLVRQATEDYPDYVDRRRAFYHASSDAEAMAPPFELVVEAYRRQLPRSKEIGKAFAIPHPVDPARPHEEVYFLVLVIRSLREESV
jgi:hypothetical protein